MSQTDRIIGNLIIFTINHEYFVDLMQYFWLVDDGHSSDNLG